MPWQLASYQDQDIKRTWYKSITIPVLFSSIICKSPNWKNIKIPAVMTVVHGDNYNDDDGDDEKSTNDDLNLRDSHGWICKEVCDDSVVVDDDDK